MQPALLLAWTLTSEARPIYTYYGAPVQHSHLPRQFLLRSNSLNQLLIDTVSGNVYLLCLSFSKSSRKTNLIHRVSHPLTPGSRSPGRLLCPKFSDRGDHPHLQHSAETSASTMANQCSGHVFAIVQATNGNILTWRCSDCNSGPFVAIWRCKICGHCRCNACHTAKA
ncbi:hypothetical protein ASPVEDRAFT_356296 [Aspergillus versicolor CBS 583.65]|uniref:Uncharacterized protein n=1 Tax=Aspergillus versicolor CBS 583.65 TaxID=1036611 RepID=A0A1L9PZZ7_ASPVE|nr:uncharacterized protein ASPVEDRAFT_356296 [Aspergillus versicolor CBS 583.65]OJJ07084.1 hypothetical protein ASPVEDRAFT_356296 [Aspergillus versicolor CBS 583.65]